MWFRIFGTNDVQPQPAALLEHLHGLGVEVAGHFHGDDHGWFKAELVLAAEPRPFPLERYLATEEDIRDELNSWAAWLETIEQNPNYGRLMQHVISTTQLFTLNCPRDLAEEALAEKLCIGVSQFLARTTAGVYQVDNRGFFAANGKLLVKEMAD